ncbi:MAG TPA: NACHT domain-containing protein, partial [Ktedonobacteraceae bacterium]|nr:NACHT domain-containing protein [Ktedonobacteraceae bacterium]
MPARARTIIHEIPGWAIRVCKRIATWKGFVGSNLMGLLVGILGTWLTSRSDTDFGKAPVGTMLHYWPIILAGLLVAWMVWGLSVRIGRLPEMKKALWRINKEYLENVIVQREKLEIEGIPAPLIYEAVALDAIFIAPRFKPHRALTDQALTATFSELLRTRIASGEVSPEIEAVLIARAREYEQQFGSLADDSRLLHMDSNVTIEDLWLRLSREEPAAVIQGTPGMGKSTLLMRLALHMARRNLGRKDDLAGQQLAPLLVPLFISLGPYATFRKQRRKSDEKSKSILEYLRSRPGEMIELSSPETVAWLEQELARGHCLVLLDALDEVSDPGERREVQDAINAFLTEIRGQTGAEKQYNRFLITSRIAGYDPNAFAYDHYTLAELTREQIADFLPRWCRASAFRKLGRAGLEEARILRQAEEIEQDLRAALDHHQGMQEMAENPFLLTLLALLRQNNYALPHRRVELYQRVCEILLIHRNDLRHLPGIPENQAIQRLGPLAYQMQAEKNSFVTRLTARNAIIEVLVNEEKMPADLAPQAADDFLQRVRERGGIFVFRAGDFLGFFHRTFQEYFAARHLLNLLAADPARMQTEMLTLARRRDALWQEPYLLALAYKNSEPSSEAQKLMLDL